ncbi:hypothetical protein QQ045_023215 [Rhodiola kirilowii]
MSGMQKTRSPKPQPGCIGRMVKLFDMDGSTAGNKLIMDKPHNRGSSLPSCPVNLAAPSEEDELILPQFRKTSGRTPMKMLLDNELSKEVEPKYTPPNLVARLMGLETLPQRQIATFYKRKEDYGRTMMDSGEPLTPSPCEPGLSSKAMFCEVEQYTDQFVSETYRQQGIKEDNEDELDVAVFGNKHVQPRHLSSYENVDSAEESEGVLEIFKSNKDLFLQLLQQPNSLFTQHLQKMSTRPPCGTKRITVLKPSKTADIDSFAIKKTEKWVRKPSQISQTNVWNKTNTGGSPVSSNWKGDDDPQPTRIVVLKPSLEKANHTKDEYTSPSLSPRTPRGVNCFMHGVQPDLQQSRDMAKEITNIIRESLGSLQMDDSFISSVLSSGYIGDESSPEKSENEYAAESDCEAMSPTSRHSWGYINQHANCSSAISHAPHARESSVGREAKKRLSKRWNAMGLNGNHHEQRHARSHSSNTLGDMLALSKIKKSIRSPDNDEEEPMPLTTCLSQNMKEDETSEYSPKNLVRSKSVPFSVIGNIDWINVGISHPEVGKATDDKELRKNNSLKQLAASLFFTRNKKCDKEISTGGSIAEVPSTHEVGLSVKKPVMTGNFMESQDQPSPISVLESLFAEDDSRSADFSGILSTEQPVMKTSGSKTSSQMIGKSPPIESIARTLCWKNPYADTAYACPLNLSLVCSGRDEEQDWYILVHALLSTVGLKNNAFVDWWDAPQMLLDPLLRDKYANAPTHFMHEAKLRRWRSNRKLIFDSVDEALKEIGHLDLDANIKNRTGYPKAELPVLMDQVWAIMGQWISDKVRCVSTDDAEDINCNLVVDRVARTEVAGKRWLDSGFMETNTVEIDVQEKLLDELLEETVLQLTEVRFTINNS